MVYVIRMQITHCHDMCVLQAFNDPIRSDLDIEVISSVPLISEMGKSNPSLSSSNYSHNNV